jgi:alpha-tubulin suppressor-like RCC1 family protein
LNTGRVLAAGTGNDGRLGDGNNANHQNLFFGEVRTGPTTPLANITKIQATYGQLMALDTTGNVWFTSANWGAMWGNGEPINQTSNGYAVVKQSGVANIWTFPRPRGSLAAFYLLTDGTLWASGQNTDFQLGVASSGVTNVVNKERVVIPRDEYPVAMKGLGIVSDTDVAYVGCMMLTNKNSLYVWGIPFGPIQNIFSNPNLRWPHRLTDFYTNPQTY